jgi:uncharacterized damage-inducible protein DinB
MEPIVEFYKYNSFVRKRYLDAMERLPWEEVVKDRGASFGSIRNVFLHVLDAYRRWFQAIIKGIPYERDYTLSSTAENYKSVNDLREFEKEIDSLVMGVIETLRDQDLSRIYVVETRDKTGRKYTMESILMHMIEEELQHRGEINCMFWQQDIDPPITGYGGRDRPSRPTK